MAALRSLSLSVPSSGTIALYMKAVFRSRLLSRPPLYSPQLGHSTGDFFRYPSGRFLFDEVAQLKQRNSEFSIAALKEVSVKATLSKECVSIVKLAEGSHNKVFLITMDSGKQAIARIPHPMPAQRSTQRPRKLLHFTIYSPL